MKKIAFAAVVLTVLGSGAALAQGIPCGIGAWQSGWPGPAGSHREQAMSAPKASTASPDTRNAARQSLSVPVAGNAQGYRKG